MDNLQCPLSSPERLADVEYDAEGNHKWNDSDIHRLSKVFGDFMALHSINVMHQEDT